MKGEGGSTVGRRGDHGRPESEIDSAHALHLPPSDPRPFPAGESEGVLPHCAVSIVELIQVRREESSPVGRS